MAKLQEMEENLDSVGSWDFEPKTETFKMMKKLRTQIKETCALNMKPVPFLDIKSHQNETPSLSSLLSNIYKVLQYNETYSVERDIVPQDIVSVLRDLISPLKWRIFKYYMDRGASTIYTLRFNLNIRKARAYRNHKLLEEHNIVRPVAIVKPVKPMTRPAQIWGLPGATEKQIKDAYQQHIKLISPRYRIAYMHVRKLDEFITGSPSRKNVLDHLIASGVPGMERRYLADLILLIKQEGM